MISIIMLAIIACRSSKVSRANESGDLRGKAHKRQFQINWKFPFSSFPLSFSLCFPLLLSAISNDKLQQMVEQLKKSKLPISAFAAQKDESSSCSFPVRLFRFQYFYIDQYFHIFFSTLASLQIAIAALYFCWNFWIFNLPLYRLHHAAFGMFLPFRSLQYFACLNSDGVGDLICLLSVCLYSSVHQWQPHSALCLWLSSQASLTLSSLPFHFQLSLFFLTNFVPCEKTFPFALLPPSKFDSFPLSLSFPSFLASHFKVNRSRQISLSTTDDEWLSSICLSVWLFGGVYALPLVLPLWKQAEISNFASLAH